MVSTLADWADDLDGFETVDIPVRWSTYEGGGLFSRALNLARSILRTRAYLKHNKVDVIHAHESAPGIVGLLARVGLGIPVVLTYHGSEPERIRSFGSVARRVDLVITPSHRAADDLASIGGVDRQKIRVIGLGINKPPADRDQDVAALREKLLRGGTRLAVTIARVSHQKGIDVLIESVARMKLTHPEYRFVVVGDGPLDAQMRQLAHDRGVDGQLEFFGRTEFPYRFLRAADVFLLTSRWEALPISIAESLQVGTPIVATDCSGVHELVDDEVGACVPVGDVDAICTELARILEDASLLESMSAAALQRSKEDRFKPEFNNRKILDAYREVMGDS